MTIAMQPPSGNPLSTRYSLLSRLQDWDDQESWKDFFDTYWSLIYSLARKAGLGDDEAQEVVQETVISVAKNIHKFERNRALGSFKSWLGNIVRWRIADQFQKRRRIATDEAEIDFENIPDEAPSGLQLDWETEWQTHVFNVALERVKRRVRAEHYLAFELYGLKQIPVKEAARTLGISIGQVYIAKHRISAMIKKEVRALQEKPF